MAGFTGTAGTIGPEFDQFDDGLGAHGAAAGPASGFRNEPIRQAVARSVQRQPTPTVSRFADTLPEVAQRQPRSPSSMFGQAIAEFEFTLTFADAPIDRFARGERQRDDRHSRSAAALLFFGKAGCVGCHAVAGNSNEMFSDFKNARHRRAADRAGLRRGQGELALRRSRRTTRTSARSRSRATRRTATSSAPRRCATWRRSRPSSTTAPSSTSRMRWRTT